MQLTSAPRAGSIRPRLSAAAGALLALGAPALSRGEAAPQWQLEATGLYYGEQKRTTVFEPLLRVTRLFADGQSISARVGFDAITGASPTGAIPSNSVQTVTSASGRRTTTVATEVPTSNFSDHRVSVDLDWLRPITATLKVNGGGHYSIERDYRSVGWSGSASLETMQRLTTITVGGGVNHDQVDPVGGTPVGLSDGKTMRSTDPQSKRVVTATVGLSRVLTRRFLVGLTGSQTREDGYLTEPYKVLSVVDGVTGLPKSELTENRPDRRRRTDLLATGVYHFARDVLYASARHYWDDWGVTSNTVDLKYRHELEAGRYVQPHVRVYHQTAADFFHYDLRRGADVPEYATSDYRLGPLSTVTLGLKYGLPVPNTPGELYIRGEYMTQFGNGHPDGAVGAERRVDLFPSIAVTTVLVGYTVDF